MLGSNGTRFKCFKCRLTAVWKIDYMQQRQMPVRRLGRRLLRQPWGKRGDAVLAAGGGGAEEILNMSRKQRGQSLLKKYEGLWSSSKGNTKLNGNSKIFSLSEQMMLAFTEMGKTERRVELESKIISSILAMFTFWNVYLI